MTWVAQEEKGGLRGTVAVGAWVAVAVASVAGERSPASAQEAGAAVTREVVMVAG